MRVSAIPASYVILFFSIAIANAASNLDISEVCRQSWYKIIDAPKYIGTITQMEDQMKSCGDKCLKEVNEENIVEKEWTMWNHSALSGICTELGGVVCPFSIAAKIGPTFYRYSNVAIRCLPTTCSVSMMKTIGVEVELSLLLQGKFNATQCIANPACRIEATFCDKSFVFGRGPSWTQAQSNRSNSRQGTIGTPSSQPVVAASASITDTKANMEETSGAPMHPEVASTAGRKRVPRVPSAASVAAASTIPQELAPTPSTNSPVTETDMPGIVDNSNGNIDDLSRVEKLQPQTISIGSRLSPYLFVWCMGMVALFYC